MSSLLANISVLSIGYNNDVTSTSNIINAFTVNQKSNLLVSASLVNPVAYSITIQALIYSQFGSNVTTVVKTLTL